MTKNLVGSIHRLQRENNPHRQTAITFSYLGKLGLTNCWDLQECKNYLQSLLLQSLKQNTVTECPLIIGLTESGIIPSALMHQNAKEQRINAQWLCSTRRRTEKGIYFSESHSHSPNHILPFPQYQPTELWFVDDEITTGRTLLNLTLHLCPLLNVKYVRYFALADTRTIEQIAQFESVLASHSIQSSTHCLVQLLSTHVANKNDVLKTEINEINADRQYQRKYTDAELAYEPDLLKAGSLLVVGEAIDVGIRMVQINPYLSFQHITLSPWQIDGKSIFSKLEICGKYYIYNYEQIQPPIYIFSDLEDIKIELEAKDILEQKGLTVESWQLNKMNTTNNGFINRFR